MKATWKKIYPPFDRARLIREADEQFIPMPKPDPAFFSITELLADLYLGYRSEKLCHTHTPNDGRK